MSGAPSSDEELPPEFAATVVSIPQAETLGTEVGPYKLMEQIGEGGFGLVFVAYQQKPVQRRVALKLIKPGMDTRDVIARFEAERQALALMDHPNIARVLDAGTTGAGRPYFVMELVPGIPITDYCDRNHLSPRERLELFIDVCNAVQHAHQKGIIHRDIKPSNVLVTLHDSRPIVKVIDFGVAKALHQKLTDRTIYTHVAQMVGTPLYMSPEQAEMSGLDIDTRTDVYSLGVLMYELLTGTTPFDKKRVAKAAYDELIRMIRDEEPPKPSTRLSESTASLPAIAEQRNTEPGRLSKMFRGDLDWITMKALEKDRTRRYETANAFAADVQRYLADEPVEASPPSAAYRIRKFVRRHRRAAMTASAFIGLLIVGVLLTGWLAVRQAAARASADRNAQLATEEAEKAERRVGLAIEAIESFRTAVDGNLDVKSRPDHEPLRKTLLQAPLAFYQKLRDDLKASAATVPDDRAKLADAYLRLAILNRDIGSQADALKAYDEAVDLLEPLSRDVALSQRNVLWIQLARALNDRGELENVSSSLSTKALESFGRAREILQAQIQDGNVAARLELARTLGDVANVEAKKGAVDSALATLRESLSVLEEANRLDPHHVGAALRRAEAQLQISAILHKQRSRIPEALAAAESALRIIEPLARTRTGDADCQLKLAEVYGALASLHDSRSEVDKALSDYRKRLAVVESLAVSNPTVTNYQYHRVLALCSVATSEGDLGQNDTALATLTKARELAGTLLRDNPTNIKYKKALGRAWNLTAGPQYALGRISDAISSIEAYAAVLAEVDRSDQNDLDTLRSINGAHYNCGLLNEQLGRPDKALAAYEQSRQLLERLIKEHADNPDIRFDLASTLGNVGVAQRGQHRYRESADSFGQAIEILKNLSTAHPENSQYQSYLVRAQLNHGDALSDLGQTTEAIAALRSALDATERMAREHAGVIQYQEDRAVGLTYLGTTLRKAGQADEALATCKKGIEICEDLLKSNPENRRNRSHLAGFFREQGALIQEEGRPGDAVKSYQRSVALLEEMASPSAEHLAELARCHARLAGLAPISGSGLPAEAARSEVDKSMEMLRRAVAVGFADVDLLQKNKDFDSVRKREDFQTLLGEMKAKTKAAK